MESVLARKPPTDDAPHLGEVPVGESIRFEVRERPICLAERGLRAKGGLQRGYGLSCAPNGLQRIAKAYPDACRGRALTHHCAVHVDLAIVHPQRTSYGGFHRLDVEFTAILLRQLLQFSERKRRGYVPPEMINEGRSAWR